MRRFIEVLNRQVCTVLAILLATAAQSHAGNKDRAGEAGAGQLLINPWTKSSGWGGANSASAVGLEAAHLNVAGMAFTQRTEILFSHTKWLSGSDVNINSLGFSQKVGESGVMGLGVTSLDFGDIQITTVELPEGGIGTFTPQYLTLGLSYAREFSNSIYGGITVKSLSEAISDAKAQGVCFDAGIQYLTGKNENIKFGISLKNVGPPMKHSGDGFSQTITRSDGELFTLQNRTAKYELPSLLNIGFAYDYYVGTASDTTGNTVKTDHRITAAGTFTANSFGKDQTRVGVEYGFKNLLMLRAGYVYETGITSISDRTTVTTGPTAGASVQVPMGKTGSNVSLDYSYIATNPFKGIHSFGIRMDIH